MTLSKHRHFIFGRSPKLERNKSIIRMAQVGVSNRINAEEHNLSIARIAQIRFQVTHRVAILFRVPTYDYPRPYNPRPHKWNASTAVRTIKKWPVASPTIRRQLVESGYCPECGGGLLLRGDCERCGEVASV